MKTLTVQLSDGTADRAEKVARELGMSVEELLQASIEEKLKHVDVPFDEAAAFVLRKNEEVYQRLL